MTRKSVFTLPPEALPWPARIVLATLLSPLVLIVLSGVVLFVMGA